MKNKNSKKPSAAVTNVLNPQTPTGEPVQIKSKHPKKPKKQYL